MFNIHKYTTGRKNVSISPSLPGIAAGVTFPYFSHRMRISVCATLSKVISSRSSRRIDYMAQTAPDTTTEQPWHKKYAVEQNHFVSTLPGKPTTTLQQIP